MTKDIDSNKASDYITKAEEFLETAKLALENKKYNSAVMNAIHSSINALDSLTASHKGKRASGRHTEVLSLIQGILPAREFAEIKKQFANLIDKKNATEYQPNLMDLDDAYDSIKSAERILARVKAKL